jgi:hypothetical protein
MRIVIFFLAICSSYFTVSARLLQDSTSKTIITLPKYYPPEKIITGDTLDTRTVRDSIILPGAGGNRFTPYQDSAYVRALRMGIPAIPRLKYDVSQFYGPWLEEQEAYDNSPYKIAERNLQLPDEVYQPTPEQVTSHQYNIERSLYVPYVNTYPRFGRFNMQAIGNALGVIEDVTPTLRYEVEYSMPVEVVIYSSQAVIVATIFKAAQPPGRYQITWNGRDDKNRELPTGDYIGEVRLGNERTIRKRIEKPFPQEF